VSDIFKFSLESARKWCDEEKIPYEAITDFLVVCQQGGMLDGDVLRFANVVVNASMSGKDYGDGIAVNLGMPSKLVELSGDE